MTDRLDALIIDESLQEAMQAVFGHSALACFQCGTCTATCPWAVISERPLSIRELMRRAQLGVDISDDSIWLCTDCGECVENCPRDVPIPEIIQAWRGWLWKNQEPEHGLNPILWSIYWNGNPLSQPPSERMNWADGMDVPIFDAEQHEYLLYVGCTASYDPRAQKTARALVRLLNEAGWAFGVLGEMERCCGECVLRLGHKPFFGEIAQANYEQFVSSGVQKIITISPHCYDVFKNHYPDAGSIEAIHYADFLQQALKAGTLTIDRIPDGKMSFHDPCLLSRINPEFEIPREILAHFDGCVFEELDRSGADSLCCGGGGGRMFLETLPGERFSDLRIQSARERGVQKLVTTCPLCISCLEDSRAAMGEESLEVMDLAELIASSIEDPQGD
ncbi:MAG: (Fe-S)-binding protein [Anaerolineales bacterium]|jgi:Fe-S oxidoreductase